jgi:hypothetical protein
VGHGPSSVEIRAPLAIVPAWTGVSVKRAIILTEPVRSSMTLVVFILHLKYTVGILSNILVYIALLWKEHDQW